MRWLLRHDACDRLRFAPAESRAACEILAAAGFPAAADADPAASDSARLQSILVLAPPADGGQPARLLTRSEAVLACLAALPAPWPQFAALARAIPRPLGDLAYSLVARLRYRLARRYDACPLPAPADRHHFLS